MSSQLLAPTFVAFAASTAMPWSKRLFHDFWSPKTHAMAAAADRLLVTTPIFLRTMGLASLAELPPRPAPACRVSPCQFGLQIDGC